MSSQKLFVIAGVRTPFARMGTALASRDADDLGTLAVRELLARTGLDPSRLDAVVVGNVGQSSRAANVARVIALRARVPAAVPAMTVHRNCASGFEAVTQCADLLRVGRGELFLAVGTESMSNYPLVFNDRATRWFQRLQKARGVGRRAAAMAGFRPSMMAPKVALLEGLTDPVVGMGMGQTAELLAREWGITREEQDDFAATSHQRAVTAQEFLRAETFDVVFEDGVLRDDNGIRADSTKERLARLRPAFARAHGTVTAGNASQITDGAVALLVGSEHQAQALGLEPLGYVEDFAYAGCDPERMGLGPVYSTHQLLRNERDPFGDIDVVEINEAFAVQVLACVRAFQDPDFCRERLGRSGPMGELSPERINRLGGAIALGHPVGASGARLVLSALLQLARGRGDRALVALCVGGGQGGSLLLRR